MSEKADRKEIMKRLRQKNIGFRVPNTCLRCLWVYSRSTSTVYLHRTAIVCNQISSEDFGGVDLRDNK